MRIRNINFNILGYVSISLLGLVSLALLLPTVDNSVHATEYCKGDNGYVECDASGTVATYAHVASVVSLGVQSNVVMDVVPKSTGVITQTPVSLRVSTNSPEGYSLYMKTMGDTNALTNMSGSDSRINPIEGQVAVPDMSTQDNVWGYSIGSNGSSDSDSDTNRIYQAVPMSQDQAVYRVDHLVEDGGDDVVDLSFASNITTSLPAGTYSNSVLISAVANPVTITNLSELVFMQDMSTDICANTAYDASGTMDVTSADIANPVTKQLIDTRDGKKYWVSKLADGNCWMVQNLALNLGTAPDAETEAKLGKFVSKLTPSDSDVSADWMPDNNTGAEIGNMPVSTGTTESWNPGLYTVAIISDSLNGCKVDNLDECINVQEVSGWSNMYQAQFGSIGDYTGLVTIERPSENNIGKFDAHYLLGNYYQQRAAMADTEVINEYSTGSICPKGWQLPRGNQYTDGDNRYKPKFTEGSIYNLTLAYGYADYTRYVVNQNSAAGLDLSLASNKPTDVSYLYEAPYYFNLSGRADTQNGGIGSDGFYWTGKTRLNSLIFRKTFYPVVSYSPTNGMVVRCLAK